MFCSQAEMMSECIIINNSSTIHSHIERTHNATNRVIVSILEPNYEWNSLTPKQITVAMFCIQIPPLTNQLNIHIISVLLRCETLSQLQRHMGRVFNWERLILTVSPSQLTRRRCRRLGCPSSRIILIEYGCRDTFQHLTGEDSQQLPTNVQRFEYRSVLIIACNSFITTKNNGACTTSHQLCK